MLQKNYYNCHAHSFTINHVPDNFGKGLFWLSFLFPIRWIKKHHTIRWLIKMLNKKWVVKLLKQFAPNIDKSLNRYLSFIRFFDFAKSQQQMIDVLMGYYPGHTRFVILTMDMEFMNAGKPIHDFSKQILELAEIKSMANYQDIIYPFIFADPRRQNVTDIVRDAIEEKKFTGIKIYPALGYYPFDKRLKDVYKYALEHDIPLTTHCISGVVFYRGTKIEAFGKSIHHPIARHQKLFGKKGIDFTLNFTHPLNFYCLMDINILRQYWGGDAPDFRNLKMCIGHFGGEDEWNKYLTDPWLPVYHKNTGSLDINNPWFDEINSDGKIVNKAYSWFSVICDMMNKFPKLYADISYTLSDERTFPLIKMLLTSEHYQTSVNGNLSVRDRILFGTDFFVVSKAGSEREMSIKLREYLGDDLFNIIACDNPVSFLKTKLN